MTADIQTLKDAIDFPALVAETHSIDRHAKVLCPFHDDHTPSCHIYKDHFHCFPCGAHGDHLDWMKQVYDLGTSAAIDELKQRAGGYTPLITKRPVKDARALPTFKPVSNHLLKQHRHSADRLRYIPQAMKGRGFTLADLQRLSFAAEGSNAVFPVPGSDGTVLALKARYARPGNGPRYRYTTPGHGTPAWCSPDFLQASTVLIVEGELNGMACYLAAPRIAVMGIAGTNGALHLPALQGKRVYIYADGDEPGQRARGRWATQALEAGASKVFLLEPWEMDACDVAGRQGREKLAKLLQIPPKSFDAVKSFSASNTASKDLRLGGCKPHLMFLCNRFSPKPRLGGKPCL